MMTLDARLIRLRGRIVVAFLMGLVLALVISGLGQAAFAQETTTFDPYSSYVVLKGGWFGSQGDYQGNGFTDAGAWEVAFGTGRIVGFEVGVGSMSNGASNIDVRMVPLLFSLRLQIPIAMVAPNAEVGAGVYFTEVKVGGATLNDTTVGWHAGFGCDLLLGRFLLGVQARYMGISPTVDTVGKLTLDRYEVLIRSGVRF
jgi:hypothetical protein